MVSVLYSVLDHVVGVISLNCHLQSMNGHLVLHLIIAPEIKQPHHRLLSEVDNFIVKVLSERFLLVFGYAIHGNGSCYSVVEDALETFDLAGELYLEGLQLLNLHFDSPDQLVYHSLFQVRLHQ